MDSTKKEFSWIVRDEPEREKGESVEVNWEICKKVQWADRTEALLPIIAFSVRIGKASKTVFG